MIHMLTEAQFYSDLLNTGFIIGPFKLPENSVIIYSDFSNISC